MRVLGVWMWHTRRTALRDVSRREKLRYPGRLYSTIRRPRAQGDAAGHATTGQLCIGGMLRLAERYEALSGVGVNYPDLILLCSEAFSLGNNILLALERELWPLGRDEPL
jgi:hypothetical protein